MTKHFVDGMTLVEWCRKTGLSYFSVYYRMVEKCETAEQAAKNIRHYPLYDGKSVRQICKENGISQTSLWYRMNKRGESLEQAVAYLVGSKEK